MIRTLAFGLAVLFLVGADDMASGLQGSKPAPYLSLAPLDPALALPPPPQPGSAAAIADEAVYRDNIKYVDTPRWEQARSDSNESAASILKGYQCAVGGHIDDQNTPLLNTMMKRAFSHMSPSVQRAKSHFDRKRPYTGDDPATPLCIPVTAHERATNARGYPSGHATSGWLAAYILVAIAPDRASKILQRASEYAESRLVCRLHYPSDVAAGQQLAAALVAQLQSSADFQADIIKARAELSKSRLSGLPAAACAGG